MTMKLYGHDTSVYVRRVRALLQEKGIPFERDARSVLTPAPEFPNVTPLMRVPALVDAGRNTLWDSRQIAEYLYERYPEPPPARPPGHPPLQPTMWRSGRRHEDEKVLLAIDAVTESAINVFLLENEGVSRDQAPYLRRQMQRVASVLTWLDDSFADQETLEVGVFSFVDIAVCCGLDWLVFRDRYDVGKHANLARILRRHRDRPSLRDTHPDRGMDWRALSQPRDLVRASSDAQR